VIIIFESQAEVIPFIVDIYVDMAGITTEFRSVGDIAHIAVDSPRLCCTRKNQDYSRENP
jgi:hypothetical protein